MSRRPDRSIHPDQPYSTGEIADLLGVAIHTVNRRIERGEFGVKGRDWWWTDPETEKGARRVRAGAVRLHLKKRV